MIDSISFSLNHEKEYPMKKRLSKFGDNMALIIDPKLLDALTIEDDTELEITTDGTCLILTPIHTEKFKTEQKQKLQKIIKENLEEYAPILENLAKR